MGFTTKQLRELRIKNLDKARRARWKKHRAAANGAIDLQGMIRERVRDAVQAEINRQIEEALRG